MINKYFYNILLGFGINIVFASASIIYTQYCDLSNVFGNLFAIYIISGLMMFVLTLKNSNFNIELFRFVGRNAIPLITASFLSALSFYFTLRSLSSDNVSDIVGVVLMGSTTPVIYILAGKTFLGDDIKNPFQFWMGISLVCLGICSFYIPKLSAIRQRMGYGFSLEAYQLLSILLDAMAYILFSKITRQQKSAKDYSGVFVFRYLIVLVPFFLYHSFQNTQVFQLEFTLSIIYLGIIPTAIGTLVKYKIVNSLGIPFYNSIASTKAIFCFIICMILFGLYQTFPSLSNILPLNDPSQPRGLDGYMLGGFTLVLSGIALSVFGGKPIPPSPKS